MSCAARSPPLPVPVRGPNMTAAAIRLASVSSGKNRSRAVPSRHRRESDPRITTNVINEIITSDGGAFKRARDAGARVSRPAEMAARVIAFEVARDRFMERLDVGILAFLKQHRDGRHSYDNANAIWECYEGVRDEDLRA